MGQADPTKRPGKPKRRRFGRRTCLRKGCGHRFAARTWNHRYCDDPYCRREVRRWRDRKRQARRRSTAEGRRVHQEAERARRQRAREKSEKGPEAREEAASGASRGHTAKGRKICDRPGCYEPPRSSVNGQARYCGDSCYGAFRRVRDRERKWLLRQGEAGCFLRAMEYARRRRRAARPAPSATGPVPSRE